MRFRAGRRQSSSQGLTVARSQPQRVSDLHVNGTAVPVSALPRAVKLKQPSRALRTEQRPPVVIWLTGRSGAGKSTIADLLEQTLQTRGRTVAKLDGDELRSGLCGDLGFSDADRDENVRRTAEVAHLMTRAGLIVIVSLISPFRQSRGAARALFAPDEFIEVYVDAPPEVAERRDPKGLYRRARQGRIAQFTGIDSPYEPPATPEIRLDTVARTADECAEHVLAFLTRRGTLRA